MSFIVERKMSNKFNGLIIDQNWVAVAKTQIFGLIRLFASLQSVEINSFI